MRLKSLMRPSHYTAKVESLYWKRAANRAELELAQVATFVAQGWDFGSAVSHLNQSLLAGGLAPFGSNGAMESVHWLLFSAISQVERVRRILEIGTFAGVGTKVLASLFPEANIVTVDVPESDPIMKGSYQRHDYDAYKAFLDRRGENLSHPNIVFVETNSFFLPQLIDRSFDLVWVDGGHKFPDVAWDICNAYNHSSERGIVLVDDVRIDSRSPETENDNGDSYRVIEYLKARGQVAPAYFLKRFVSVPRHRKYVALLRKGDGLSGPVAADR